MEDWSCAMRKSYSFSEDLEEGEVWDSVKEGEDSSDFINRKSSSSSSSSSSRRLPTAPRMIPKAISTRVHEPQMAKQSSAPMEIPDWSKIYGKMGSSVEDYHGGGEDDDMVPPHEWIAQKLARSNISSFSVCEGVGRKLKGRDLSQVRNAILTKTGFLE